MLEKQSRGVQKPYIQTTSLCYSIAKPTLKGPLTLNKVQKTKHEISVLFIFPFLRSSSPSHTCVTIALLMEVFLYLFRAVCEL